MSRNYKVEGNEEARGRERGKRHVYFIQCGESGPIKIGLAANVKSRLDELQVCNPSELYLRGIIRFQGMRGEAMFHGMFKHLHIRGEWFEPAPDLILYIRQNAFKTKDRNHYAGLAYGWPKEE